MFALWLGGQFEAIDGSPVSQDTYQAAFGNTWRVIAASMTAYLVAQFLDVRLFHFWRDLTRGRHLWLRNNASTVVSQLLDSVLVVLVLFWGLKPADELLGKLPNGCNVCVLGNDPKGVAPRVVVPMDRIVRPQPLPEVMRIALLGVVFRVHEIKRVKVRGRCGHECSSFRLVEG